MTAQKGFIVLTAVITIMAVVLLVGMSTVLRSISETDMSANEELATRVLGLANTCGELGLIKLRNNFSYSGDEDIIVQGSDSCHIYPTEGTPGSNTNRGVKADARIKGYTRRISVDIGQLNPLIINSWQEVANF